MNNEFFLALDALEKEKGIPKDYMIERIEAALVGAYKKEEGGNSNVRVSIDEEKRTSAFFSKKQWWKRSQTLQPKFRSRKPKR